MAKKKVNNVVIKDEELTPTTIGVYSNKTKNPIGLLILIAIFISIPVFMPQIQSYVNKYFGNNEEVVESNNNNQDDDDIDIDDNNQVEIKKYDVNVGNVETDAYAIKNIVFSGNTLSFTFKNKTSSAFDLSDYYFELYSSDETFIQRIKVSSGFVDGQSAKDFSFNVSSGVAQFSFVKKTINDYPAISLNYNENREANYICKSNGHVYNYLFIDDQLAKVTYTYTVSRTNNANYYSISQEYQNKSNANNALMVDGITSTFSETLNDFYYTLNVDLNKADTSSLNDENLFQSKTEPRVVKFILEAKGFTCQQ